MAIPLSILKNMLLGLIFFVPFHFQIRSYGPEFSLELSAISLFPHGLCFFHCELNVSIVKRETGKFSLPCAR